MSEIGLVLSWILQLIGLLIVLGSNLWFFFRARTGKFRSVKKEFARRTDIQVGMTDEELQEARADDVIETFTIANLLYRNYRDSIIGTLFTLAGVVLGAAIIFV